MLHKLSRRPCRFALRFGADDQVVELASGANGSFRLMQVEGLQGRPRRRFRVLTTEANRWGDARAESSAAALSRRGAQSRVDQRYYGVAHRGRLDLPGDRARPLLAAHCRWAMRSSLVTDLVLAALHMAVGRRRPAPGLVHHSDRGRQYTSDVYQTALRAHGMRCSLSLPGNCFDNAPSESFFRTLKVELDATYWPTRAAARQTVATFIERFYNTERLHSSLDYRSRI